MIITSLLDTDLYKYRMLALAYHSHKDVVVEYAFKCRNDIDLTHLKDDIIRELKHLCTLKFTNDEISYINSYNDDKLKFLSEYTTKPFLDFNGVNVSIENGQLSIRIKGLWWKKILFEVFVLAIVNELYFSKLENKEFLLKQGEEILNYNIGLLNKFNDIRIVEFGTRRRFSKEWQDHVLEKLEEVNNHYEVIGSTSNVYFAYKHGLEVSGTMAHEAFQVYQGIYHPIISQRKLLTDWYEFWRGKNTIALTDIFPHQKFLKDFDQNIASKYAGIRHDSGNVDEWTDSMIEHYLNAGIDPKDKIFMFSDGLDIPEAIRIHEKYKNTIDDRYGIGTKLTNDMGKGHTALQIVMKIVSVNGNPVAKISNNLGKSMCEDPVYQNWLIHAINKDIENG